MWDCGKPCNTNTLVATIKYKKDQNALNLTKQIFLKLIFAHGSGKKRKKETRKIGGTISKSPTVGNCINNNNNNKKELHPQSSRFKMEILQLDSWHYSQLMATVITQESPQFTDLQYQLLVNQSFGTELPASYTLQVLFLFRSPAVVKSFPGFKTKINVCACFTYLFIFYLNRNLLKADSESLPPHSLPPLHFHDPILNK